MFHNTFVLSATAILGNVEHVKQEDTNEFRPGYLVGFGREWVNYLKKFLLSGGTYAATAIGPGGSESDGKAGGSCDPRTGKPTRRTELPLYGDCPEGDVIKADEEEPGNLEKGISAVRKELWVWHDKYKGYEEKVKDIVVTGKEHTGVLIEQLRKDELPVPRTGAIAISGLAGLILGLRGGWFKRLFYGTTCAGLMAAICYPNEVAVISQDTLAATKKYVVITYNFIYGEGKPEKPVRIVKQSFPEAPSPRGTQEAQSSSSQDPSCTCHLSPGTPPCAVHGQTHNTEQTSEEETQQVAFHTSSNISHFDHFAEQAADVTKSPRPNDQSNPADKDLYSSKR